MGLFGRKKEEDFEDDYDELDGEEEKSSLREERRFKKGLKDLKPQNKKSRKEPVKPWGKKERVIVASIFGVTILASAFLSLSSRNFKLPNFPKLSFSTKGFDLSSLNPFGEKVVEIKNGKGSVQGAVIKKDFIEKTNSLSGIYSIYVYELESKNSFGVNENEIMQAASLIKLPVLGLLFDEAEKGNIDLDSKYILKNSDKVGGSGSLQGKPAGTVLTYRDMARLMGKESDNTAFNIVRNKLTDAKIESYVKEIGMTKTSLKENQTTASDIGKFFLLQNKNKELMGNLTNTIYEEFIPKGVPTGVTVSHKFGREVHVINDAGIVNAEKPYIIVILSDGIVDEEGVKIIPELSKLVYDNLGN